jgi:hypothetical protein
MTIQEYLQELLRDQDLTPAQQDTLQRLRARVEEVVGVLPGSQRFYYAGSYGKKTIIREHYDLDVVVYWPGDCNYTLKSLFFAVGDLLQKEWKSAHPKTVAWEIAFQGGFHIDVVPGRAIDSTYTDANLYRRDKDSTLKTSIKTHIDTVRDSSRRDAIRLMKLWKARKGVQFKTFILELMTIDGCKGQSLIELEPQLLAAFRYIRDNITTARVVDPANTNNIISDDISSADKAAIKAAAQATLNARYWGEVF